MKTANRGKTILAVLLALTMVLPAVAGMAEGEATEVGDVKWLSAYAYESGTLLYYKDEAGSQEQVEVPSGTAITAGDVNNEDRKEAVRIESISGDVSVTANAVNSETDGVTINNIGGTLELAVDEVQAKQDGLYIYNGGSGAGNKPLETTVTVAKDVHTVAEVLEPEVGEVYPEIVGVEVCTSRGKIAVEVAGEVSAEATAAKGELQVYGVNLSRHGESTGTMTEITAGGAKATAAVEGGSVGNAEATAVQVSPSAGQTIKVTVNGSAEAEATNKAERGIMAEATAVQASACAGQTIEVTVNGSAEAEVTNEAKGGRAEATAVEATASGEGAQVTVTVSGDMSAIAKETAEIAGATAKGVRLKATEGGTVTFTAADSNITATSEAAYFGAEAVKLDNGGGDISAEIVGNVTASGDNDNTGVVVQSTFSSVAGNTDLTVTGDVSADIGVELAIDEVQTANITVDGTIEGETAGILLREDTKLSDDITMTVWEVKPDSDGAVVVREEWKDEEKVRAEDAEAEKLIQYIIKVEDTSKDYITTDGTKAFTAGNGNVYQVAHEGDKVLVKLNIPEGKELVDAFWDAAKSQAGRLLKDAEGNYYLEVPRGGGVLLSVTLKDVPKQESKGTAQTAEAKPYSYVLAPILKVRDQTGMVEIDFYRDKRFIVTLENREQEKGTFRTEDGILILKCADETEFSFDMGEGTVVYITRDGRNVHYNFHLKPDELEILVKLK